MSNGKSHHQLFRLLEKTLDYWLDLTAMEFTGDLQHILDQQGGMSYSELARRAGTSQPYISKVFSGSANFTLKTMIKLARAVDAVLHVRLTREDEVVRVMRAEDLVSTTEASRTTKYLLVPENMNSPFASSDYAILLTSQGSQGHSAYAH